MIKKKIKTMIKKKIKTMIKKEIKSLLYTPGGFTVVVKMRSSKKADVTKYYMKCLCSFINKVISLSTPCYHKRCHNIAALSSSLTLQLLQY